MTSVLVVGNCHLYGMRRSLRFFDSALRVEGLHVTELRQRFNDVDGFAEHARGFDHLLTMPFDREAGVGFTADEVVARHERATVFPTVTFAAFHPDVVYVTRQADTGAGPGAEAGADLQSPLGPFHSALIYYGFRRGWPAARTESLFRPDVFEGLGYLSTWDVSMDAIGQAPAAAAFDLPGLLLAAVRRGCFMHNPQHPKAGLIAAIARKAAGSMGLRLQHDDAEPFLPDDLLASHVWPLYPAIASFYGLEGSYTFKRQTGIARFPEFMTLREFIEACYEMYTWQSDVEYECERVDGWLRDGTGPEPA